MLRNMISEMFNRGFHIDLFGEEIIFIKIYKYVREKNISNGIRDYLCVYFTRTILFLKCWLFADETFSGQSLLTLSL